MTDLIMENIADPHELEKIYRQDPDAFKKSLLEVWKQRPDSQIIAAWYERLYYQEDEEGGKPFWLTTDFLVLGIIAILAAISTRIIFHYVEQKSITPFNLLFGVVPFMAAYFLYNRKPKRSVIVFLAASFLISALYINMLPLDGNDSVILAYLHLPVFLWILSGLAYTGDEYNQHGARLSYLKFNGEFCIIYASMAICGMLLTALTRLLFIMLDLDIGEFYFKNIVLFGAAALAVVASYILAKELKFAKNIAPYLAKIFSPLIMLTLLAYLGTVIWVGKNPFLDRNFLLSFNGILLSVLAVTIFSISESGMEGKKTISDYINFALIGLALVIDSVALAAILFRLSSYGITPNRSAVLGVNLLIFINLARVQASYLRFFQNKIGLKAIQEAITGYLPFYGLWAAFVIFFFPLIFN